MKDGFVCIIHMKLFTMLSNVCHMIIGDLFETSHSNINSLQVDPLVIYFTLGSKPNIV